ncbi:MAG: hypothetical protein ACPF9R_04400 [Acholeplasmataceae bacterium]
MIPRKYVGETVVIIATGPSLNEEQVNYVSHAHAQGECRVLTINNSYQLAPWADIHVACNDNWWDYYWKNDEVLRNMKADKWTRYKHQADEFGIKYINSIVKNGLSKDQSVVHINKGSGPLAINFATLYGFKKIILLGHDMKFAKDYNGAQRKIGSSPRHFFGEYPKEMQHFPRSKNSIDDNGVIIGLIEAYNGMVKDLDEIDIVNCTPDSHLPTFRKSKLEKEL